MDLLEQDTLEEPTPVPRRRGRILLWIGAIILVLFAVGSAAAFIVLVSVAQNLPTLRSLNDYRPPQATVVYGHDGEVVARFAQERRTVVAFENIPKVMVDAVIAAEDADYFSHEGVDYLGILRCAFKNAVSGRTRCGGSTITQQTVKTFLLSPEQTYVRKLKELILAKRIEEALSKEDILFLYLNQIYFGHGAYGIQEAARIYFGVDVGRLNLEQATLLAGLPKSPSRLDPYRHPQRARERRAYVLERMETLSMIDGETRTRATASDLGLAGTEDAALENSHYAAHVKRLLIERFGERATVGGGLKVFVGVLPSQQKASEAALEAGLRVLDKRRGFRGPRTHLERNELSELLDGLQARLDEVDFASGRAVWNLASADVATANPVDAILEAARFEPFEVGRVHSGVVTDVDDSARTATVNLGKVQVVLPLRTGLAWARPDRNGAWSQRPRKPSDVLAIGDVVDVRAVDENQGKVTGVLEQEPLVEGALVAIDPHTREVRALVGGRGLGAGRFNRAVQARRQPGSTFKPFVYAAAFASRRFTPVSKCLDAPRVYRDPWTGKSWKPENYGGSFDGELSLRQALTLSKNLCSVELIDRVGVEPVVEMARRAGIQSALPRNLTLALGSGDVTPLEIVNAYTTFADQGRYAPPIFLRKVVSPANEVLFEQQASPELRVPPGVAYQVTSLMQSVVEDGTARAVRDLGRPVAGKTGTTNEARDAWFVGFTPDLVAGVWVGFDDNRPLGPGETGGRAAIPIWLDFMRAALVGTTPREFVPPADVVFAHVEPESARLAPLQTEGARTEPFLPGTEPTELFEPAVPADRGIWEDYQ
ncbi:MAG: penicillin-binding protein 1A [Myxococcota bacterium]